VAAVPANTLGCAGSCRDAGSRHGAALGVNQKWLFTSVFAVGVFLAALGGALQIPRDAVHHALDLRIIVDVFVVVVIGGLGSIIGAFVAAVLVSELNAFAS